MAGQYPPTAEARRALAAYLVHDLQVNPMTDLIPALLGTHTVKEDNGMLVIGNLSFPESIVNTSAPSQPIPESAFVRLAVHCLALAAPVHIVASFVQAEHMARPTSSLCTGMWNALAFLHVAPQVVCTALQCQRPDIIHAAQQLYGRWLMKCRAPQHISAVLEYLTTAQWHCESGSKACAALAALMKATQAAAAPVKHVAKADIVVDKRAGIIVSRRDKCFLALALINGPHRDNMTSSVKAFKIACDATPEAFVELPKGCHVLDEVI